MNRTSQTIPVSCVVSIVRTVSVAAVLLLTPLCPRVTEAAGSAAFAVQQAGDLPTQKIRDVAKRVMQQNDFRSVRRRVLENIPASDADKGFLEETLGAMGTAIGDFFDWIFSGMFTRAPVRPRPGTTTAPAAKAAPSTSGGLDFNLSKTMLYMGLAALVGLAIWIIGSVVRKSDPNRRLNRKGLFGDDEAITDLSVPPGELAASTYETRAMQMAGEGNFRGAIRELLIGSMSWIERAGLIRFRKGLTNRDYVRAVWREEDRRLAYATTAMEFERVYFGRRDATRDKFEHCLTLFQGSFREEEATTAAV